jgi:trimeric autotransporter adhesin
MKIPKSYLLIVAAITAASVFMACDQSTNTLSEISITPATQSMAKGTRQQFTAIGTFTNGMSLHWSQVLIWSSNNTDVATVYNVSGSISNGLVTAVGAGTAVITAYDEANDLSTSATITVTDPSSITVMPANPYMAIGTRHQFSAIALFSSPTDTQDITTFATWTTSPAGIATIIDTSGVFGNGIVTAGTSTGTAIIQADFPITSPSGTITISGTTTLTVTGTPIVSMAIDPINPIISMATTTLQQFTAIGTFRDGSTTPSLTAPWTWSSLNTEIATIDKDTGLAQAVAAGTTTIVAKDPITGVSGNTTLTVQ